MVFQSRMYLKKVKGDFVISPDVIVRLYAGLLPFVYLKSVVNRSEGVTLESVTIKIITAFRQKQLHKNVSIIGIT